MVNVLNLPENKKKVEISYAHEKRHLCVKLMNRRIGESRTFIMKNSIIYRSRLLPFSFSWICFTIFRRIKIQKNDFFFFNISFIAPYKCVYRKLFIVFYSKRRKKNNIRIKKSHNLLIEFLKTKIFFFFSIICISTFHLFPYFTCSSF